MTVILRFSPYLVALGADYVKVVEDRPIQSVTEVTENECIIERHLCDIHPLLDYDASERQSTLSV